MKKVYLKGKLLSSHLSSHGEKYKRKKERFYSNFMTYLYTVSQGVNKIKLDYLI